MAASAPLLSALLSALGQEAGGVAGLLDGPAPAPSPARQALPGSSASGAGEPDAEVISAMLSAAGAEPAAVQLAALALLGQVASGGPPHEVAPPPGQRHRGADAAQPQAQAQLEQLLQALLPQAAGDNGAAAGAYAEVPLPVLPPGRSGGAGDGGAPARATARANSSGAPTTSSGGNGGAVAARGGSNGAASADALQPRADRFKEKNRLAQQRFRAKQKSMLENMKLRMAELEETVAVQAQRLAELEHREKIHSAIIEEQAAALRKHGISQPLYVAAALSALPPPPAMAPLSGAAVPATGLKGGAVGHTAAAALAALGSGAAPGQTCVPASSSGAAAAVPGVGGPSLTSLLEASSGSQVGAPSAAAAGSQPLARLLAEAQPGGGGNSAAGLELLTQALHHLQQQGQAPTPAEALGAAAPGVSGDREIEMADAAEPAAAVAAAMAAADVQATTSGGSGPSTGPPCSH